MFIYFQNLTSIQPRTSLLKFEGGEGSQRPSFSYKRVHGPPRLISVSSNHARVIMSYRNSVSRSYSSERISFELWKTHRALRTLFVEYQIRSATEPLKLPSDLAGSCWSGSTRGELAFTSETSKVFGATLAREPHLPKTFRERVLGSIDVDVGNQISVWLAGRAVTRTI